MHDILINSVLHIILDLCIIIIAIGTCFFFYKQTQRHNQNIIDNEKRIQAIMDNTVDGLITIDDKGTIERFNHGAEAAFGYKAKEVIGKNVSMLMPEPDRSKHDNYIRNYHETGERKIIGIGREVVGLKKDGYTFDLELSVNEIIVSGKKLYSGIIRDISERKKAENELIRSNKELDDFAYIASHDLKEPLRGIHNHARLLVEDYKEKLDEDGQHKIDRIMFLSQRMETLISDLFYYSRLGRTQEEFIETDLNEIVSDARDMLAEENNVTITIKETLPTIKCDRMRIMELYRNLITNAIKYNDSKDKQIEIGTKSVTTSNRRNETVFYVKDKGIGIDFRFHEDIFKIFKRLHKRDAYGGGTGSGLTFVKKIVEKHKGEIWLESEPDKGTTFYFTLREQK